MEVDKALLIPHLSKELGLLGLADLPYTCHPVGPNRSTQVAFDNKRMLASLITCCFDLVKRVKNFDAFTSEAESPLCQVKNEMLKANIKSLTSDVNKLEDKLYVEKEKHRQLNIKYDLLVDRLKSAEDANRRLSLRTEEELRQLQTQNNKMEVKCLWYCDLLQKKLHSEDLDLAGELLDTIVDLDPGTYVMSRDVTLLDAFRQFKKNCSDLRSETSNLKNVIGMVLDNLHDLIMTAADKMQQNIQLEGKAKVKTKFLNTKMSAADARSLNCYIQHVFVLLQQLIECVPS